MPTALQSLLLDALRQSAIALERLDGRQVIVQVGDRAIHHSAAALAISLECRSACARMEAGESLLAIGDLIRDALESALAGFTTLHGSTVQASGDHAAVSDQSDHIVRCAAAISELDGATGREIAIWGDWARC